MPVNSHCTLNTKGYCSFKEEGVCSVQDNPFCSLGDSKRKPYGKRQKTEVYMKIIERLNNDGLNDSEIAGVLNVSSCYVANLRKKMKIPPIRKHRSHKKKQGTEEILAAIRRMNRQKKNDSEIAQELGVSRQYVHQIRHKQLGLPAHGRAVSQE